MQNKNNNGIKIKIGKSSLSEFIKRPLPSDKEAEAFDQYVENEARDEEIKDSLTEIYKDNNGELVNVKKMDKRKSKGLFFRFFILIFFLAVLTAASYFGYYFYLKPAPELAPITINLAGEKEITSGKEFFYTLDYRNEDRVGIKNIEISVVYPNNFIFLDSQPAASQGNNIFRIGYLGPHRSDIIKIKGKLIGETGNSYAILADMTYTPENFSSEFKKTASCETMISDIGIDFAIINSSSAIVGNDNELTINYKARKENYLNNFLLAIEAPENIEFIKNANSTATTTLKSQPPEALKPNTWYVDNIAPDSRELNIKFKLKEKKSDQLDLILKFSNLAASSTNSNGKEYLFYQKTLTYQAVNSDLNLNLIINGSPADQGVDFGQTLNYSLVYANKGETGMKDVLIMAVLESDFLNWQSLNDKNNGKVSGNTISWSKLEIPALADLGKNDEGTIDFSLKIKPPTQIDLNSSYQVKSYAQYSIEGRATKDSEAKSNIIVNKINSDLKLNEQVRYFNDDNIAVGSGPLPPKVGETTSFKVNWTINNNLHELSDLTISASLPAYASWDNKNQATVGTIYYDSQNNKVIWQIGRLPIMVYTASAEFNISLTPSESDRNKILVLLSGTNINALDSETKSLISKTMPAKTTKLTDDKIANTDGVVQ